MKDYKHRIRDMNKFYSQDLLNILFNHLYNRIDFLVQTPGVTRKTAARYLDELAEGDLFSFMLGYSLLDIGYSLFSEQHFSKKQF